MRNSSVLTLLIGCHTASAFVGGPSSTRRCPQLSIQRPNSIDFTLHSFFGGASSTIMEDLSFVSPDTTGIAEQACIDAAREMKRIAVPVSKEISLSGSVGISYIHWQANSKKRNAPPLILLHGFDSSCLEYRRLGPQLASRGIDIYAVDILGWGFTQLSDITDFSANSKVEALISFVKTKLGPSTPFVVAGASLGGAAAIELASASTTCAGLVLIDAQGFVDGVGPMASLPKPLAQLGVGVLKSVPLRNMANKMSYYDVGQFATEEAQVIGRLHCLRDGWSGAMVSFMQSGGFSPSSKISKVTAPALVLWGRQDGILDGKEFANKFVEELPNAQLQWIEECGHVPHLEQPEETAAAIASFLTSTATKSASNGRTNLVDGREEEVSPSTYYVGGGVIGAIVLEELIKQFF
ncbi:alpha/beta hydrolase fold [Nitzschia inconspicua]|uniref:Alpha/beta hydrolase fold n=1 Tax=Nitzschia inconspicua TaxID=303405 RepID=A0A9K3PUM3_9STRA|nr:alpha/beta hydrolase fold [Nitzschia inconspicua]